MIDIINFGIIGIILIILITMIFVSVEHYRLLIKYNKKIKNRKFRKEK